MRRDGGTVAQVDQGCWARVLLRMRPVMSPVQWSVTLVEGGEYVVEVNRGCGFRVEAGFPSLTQALAYGRTLHGDGEPKRLRPRQSLSYKG